MDELRFRFLGGISVVQGDEERSDRLPGKALALLCYLAVTGEAQSREMLAGLLWSDFPEHRARSNLRNTLTALRRTPLAPFVIPGRRMVSFNQDLPYWLDTAEFQKGVEQDLGGISDGPSDLETATEHYGGEFVAGFHVPKAALFEEWVTVQRQHFHLLAVEALQKLVDFHLDAASYEAGIQHACHLLNLDPWCEQNHRNVMLLRLLNGEHSASLAQYEACRQILADELGVAPTSETQTLYQNIRKQIDDHNGVERLHLVPDVSSPSGPFPHNITGQVTPFIGREREHRAIDNVLNDRNARLVTIFGVGGSGKTRLAIALGEKQAHVIERDGGYRFPDGVYFVPLEAVESPSEIVSVICRALGFQLAEESRDGRSLEGQLLNFLHRKRLLLIVDNFEQLLDGVGLLARIHRSAPEVHLLVTSRQKLALQGERLFALEGLPYPQVGERVTDSEQLLADYSAAALFATSARRVQPDYQLHDEEVPALIRLCRLVDGLPLAIELAAGWTSVLSLTDIVAEIEQGLSFLESDLHDLPDRHRSMEAVFDVTWRRLANAEQTIFMQLCAFRGGFTRLTAKKVAGSTLRQLASLANKALLQYDRESDRYQIHPLLRQFGKEKLAQDPAAEDHIRGRHCSYFCALLQQWNRLLKGAGQLEALAEFDKESANARTAWVFAAETQQFAELARAADGLSRLYLWRRRFREGKSSGRLAEKSLLQVLSAHESTEHAAELKRILAKILTWQSVFCDRAKASELLGQALEILNNPELATEDTRHERAFALQRAGDLAFDSDGEQALRLYKQSLALYRELGDEWRTAKVLTALGWRAAHDGEMEEAGRFGEEALVLVRAIGDQKRTADVLWLLGTLAIFAGQVERSKRLLGESLDIREMLGDRITDIAAGPLDLGMTLTWIGRMAEADAVREETLALYEAQGQPEQIAIAHVRLATSKLHVGQFDAMRRHASIGLELCRELGEQHGTGLALWMLGNWATVEGKYHQAESWLQESLACLNEVEGAAEISWIFATLANVTWRLGHSDLAKSYFVRSLRTASGVFGLVTNLVCLLGYRNLLADEGQLKRAIEMSALLEENPMIQASSGFRVFFAVGWDGTTTTLSPEVVAEAETRGRARDLQETAAEILAELEEIVRA